MPVRYVRRGAPADDAPRGPVPVYAGPGAPPAYPVPATPPAQRSHVAAVVALLVVAAGVYLASWTVLAPATLALLLFSSGLAFLGARLNPLSIGFYLTVKPSWTAIGAVLLGGFLLLAIAYSYWRHGWGPIIPQRFVPW